MSDVLAKVLMDRAYEQVNDQLEIVINHLIEYRDAAFYSYEFNEDYTIKRDENGDCVRVTCRTDDCNWYKYNAFNLAIQLLDELKTA